MATLQLSLPKSRIMDQPRQSVRALLGGTKSSAQPKIDAIMKSDTRTAESFTNLKLTADKMMQEQACVKTGLLMVNSKLQKSEELVRNLELKLQESNNENAMLKVKQREDLKLWNGLDSKFLSSQALFDQITETIHDLEGQLQEAELHKSFLQEKLQERLSYHEEMEVTIKGLVRKLEKAETEVSKWKEECTEKQKNLERLNGQCTAQMVDIQESSKEIIRIKEELLSMKALIEANQQALAISQAEHDKMKQVSDMKSNELDCLNKTYFDLMEDKGALEARVEELRIQLSVSVKENEIMSEEKEILLSSLQDMEKVNSLQSDNIDRLVSEITNCNGKVQTEIDSKNIILVKLKQVSLQLEQEKCANESLQQQLQDSKTQIDELQKHIELRANDFLTKEQAAQNELKTLEQTLERMLTEKHKLEESVQVSKEKAESVLSNMNDLQKDKDDLIQVVSEMKAASQTVETALQEKINGQERKEQAMLQSIALLEQQIISQQSDVNRICQECHELCISKQKLEEEKKLLEEQKTEIQAQVVATEKLTLEIKKQSEYQLEEKQAELTRHLKEISQRNNQEMNDIRRKYEIETKEAISKELQKAESELSSIRRHHEEQLSKQSSLFAQNLQSLQQEHAHLVRELRDSHEQDKRLTISKFEAEVNEKHEIALHEIREQTLLDVKKIERKMEEMEKDHELNVQKLEADHERHISEARKEIASLKQEISSFTGGYTNAIGKTVTQQQLKVTQRQVTQQQATQQLKITQQQHQIIQQQATKRKRKWENSKLEDARRKRPKKDTIADLFGGKCLDPYEDDPYAFD